MTHTKCVWACYSMFLTTLGIIKYFSVLANMRYICLYIHVRIDMFYIFIHIDVFIYLFTTQQPLVLWLSHMVVSDLQLIEFQAPLSMGFFRQDYWNGLPFPSPGDLPNPGIEPGSPVSHTYSFRYQVSHQGSPYVLFIYIYALTHMYFNSFIYYVSDIILSTCVHLYIIYIFIYHFISFVTCLFIFLH